MDRNNSQMQQLFAYIVALRKESVDRNTIVMIQLFKVYGRSPQGERG